jgi:hypothetical protein
LADSFIDVAIESFPAGQRFREACSPLPAFSRRPATDDTLLENDLIDQAGQA